MFREGDGRRCPGWAIAVIVGTPSAVAPRQAEPHCLRRSSRSREPHPFGGFCPKRRTLSAAATRDPAPLTLGCPSPHTVVDVLFERELEALRSYGALGTIMAGDLHACSISRKEDGGWKLPAPGVKHPGGYQTVGKPLLLPFSFVHVRLLCCSPAPRRGRVTVQPGWSICAS